MPDSVNPGAAVRELTRIMNRSYRQGYRQALADTLIHLGQRTLTSDELRAWVLQSWEATRDE